MYVGLGRQCDFQNLNQTHPACHCTLTNDLRLLLARGRLQQVPLLHGVVNWFISFAICPLNSQRYSRTFMKPEGIAEESWGEPSFVDSICQTTLIAASASPFLKRNVMADRNVLGT